MRNGARQMKEKKERMKQSIYVLYLWPMPDSRCHTCIIYFTACVCVGGRGEGALSVDSTFSLQRSWHAVPAAQ